MSDHTGRSIEEIMEDLQHINQEFQEKIRNGFKDPDSFIKLREIEEMGKNLSIYTQKLYLEETEALLNEIDESMLLCKKKQSTRQKE